MNFEISELNCLTVDLFFFGFTLRLCLDTNTNQSADKSQVYLDYLYFESYIFDNVCLYEFQVYELFMSYYKS